MARGPTLAPTKGLRTATEVAPGVAHQLPSETDCRACHGSGGESDPLLGFSALQLSSDRDPNALHAETAPEHGLDLEELVARGMLSGYDGPRRPRITARNELERTALGYLHGNCGGCHNERGALSSLGMVLSSSVDARDQAVLATTLSQPTRFAPGRVRIAAGDAENSVVVERMQARTPVTQMPPLGTQLVDTRALELVRRWIDRLPPSEPEQQGQGT
jgi:hypothetical protein